MQYPKAREVFKGALQILCSDGSFSSRLERVITVISEISPYADLPDSVLVDFSQLKASLNQVTNFGVTPVSRFQPNRMEQLIIIEKIISIYKLLVEATHDDALKELIKQLESRYLVLSDEKILELVND
ncbi:hypothetical protein [Shewanella kaireitica]|uniref:hypothetical protein n=1 Tax=Shewanella kaireitica TaxID=212021 RepID=UPI00200CFFEA|nr:hypothetical protein [Shewanella kaireitica]MCL1093452.1 hypothetical protein [Shewanella kaireitica]